MLMNHEGIMSYERVRGQFGVCVPCKMVDNDNVMIM